MGTGSPICERERKKIVEYFKNNVPQRQNAKDLQISSSTVHNLTKRFRETGEISVRKGQARRPLLDACGLRHVLILLSTKMCSLVNILIQKRNLDHFPTPKPNLTHE